MKDFEKFSLYGETNASTTDAAIENNPLTEPDRENEVLITLDFSKETFGQMVEKVRNVTESRPESIQLNFFILSGFSPHPDSALILGYIKSLKRDCKFFVRGIIHLEFLDIFTCPNLYINSNSKLKFDPTKLQEIQNQLLRFPDVFRIYFQRYIDVYHKFKGSEYLDVTELKTLGFNFETY